MAHVSSEDIVARQRLKSVKDQIVAAKDAPKGTVAQIVCPYCNTLNFEGGTICCETMRKAVITILMGLRQDAIEEKARRNAN